MSSGTCVTSDLASIMGNVGLRGQESATVVQKPEVKTFHTT